MKCLASLVALSFVTACSGATNHHETTASSASPSISSRAPSAAMAPTPYTAEQIRDASSIGRTYTFRVEAPGRPTVLRTMTFVAVSPEGTDVSTEVRDEHDAVLQPAQTEHATWDELRRHAEFPAAALQTREENVTVPAGTYPCVIYTVRHDDDGTIWHFAFARNMPGPPVQFGNERNGAPEMNATLVSYRSGR